MARDGITFEQVAAAADALVGQGKQPTIKAIREKLGTGSPNTVHRHLTSWREARPQAVATASVLPASLTAAIAAEIERAAAQARAEIEARLVHAQAEAADLSGAGEALEVERDALVEQVTGLTTERDTLAGKAAQQAAELVHLRAALAESQQARQQAEQAAAVAAAKLDAMADRAARADTRVEKMEKQVLTAARDLTSANAAVQAGQARLESAAREIDDAKKAVADARTAAKKAGEESAELRGKMTAMKAANPSS